MYFRDYIKKKTPFSYPMDFEKVFNIVFINCFLQYFLLLLNRLIDFNMISTRLGLFKVVRESFPLYIYICIFV